MTPAAIEFSFPKKRSVTHRRADPSGRAPALAQALALLWIASACGCSELKEGPSLSEPVYVDVAEIAGVIGRLVVGGEEKNHILEVNTGAACLFDYDGDGDQDIFLTNGSRRSGFAPGREPRGFVYRNDGDWRFTDVSAATGANVHAWGMGCSAVDYDGDGWMDL